MVAPETLLSFAKNEIAEGHQFATFTFINLSLIKCLNYAKCLKSIVTI